MNREKMLKIAIIAGASAAAKYLRDNKDAGAEDAIKHVNKKVDEILSNIDEDD